MARPNVRFALRRVTLARDSSTRPMGCGIGTPARRQARTMRRTCGREIAPPRRTTIGSGRGRCRVASARRGGASGCPAWDWLSSGCGRRRRVSRLSPQPRRPATTRSPSAWCTTSVVRQPSTTAASSRVSSASRIRATRASPGRSERPSRRCRSPVRTRVPSTQPGRSSVTLGPIHSARSASTARRSRRSRGSPGQPETSRTTSTTPGHRSSGRRSLRPARPAPGSTMARTRPSSKALAATTTSRTGPTTPG